jgi:hypothetical protein
MSRAWNNADTRRVGLPRDYLADPFKFGNDDGVALTDGPTGDAVSARIAHTQHYMIVAWRAIEGRPSGAEIGRRYGVSRATVSRAMLGQRWFGETLLCGFMLELRREQAERDKRENPCRCRAPAPAPHAR